MVNLHKIAQTGKACIPARILEAIAILILMHFLI